jgi:hypothetical protein
MPVLRRHLLPICCTAIFILAAWMILSLPIAAVFLIDDALILSDYFKFVFYAAGAGIGISLFVMFPLSLLLERLATRTKLLFVAAPILLLGVSAVGLLGQYLLTGQISSVVLSGSILLVILSFVFGFYWVVLHLGNAVLYRVQRLLRRTPSS